jgi:hypothetical protein
LERKEIGVIGGGRRKPTGRIDVALIQSLVRKGEVSDLISGYGQLIVDECHHLSARSFELVTQRSKAHYVLGLSATVTRKDGHHPIILGLIYLTKQACFAMVSCGKNQRAENAHPGCKILRRCRSLVIVCCENALAGRCCALPNM